MLCLFREPIKSTQDPPPENKSSASSIVPRSNPPNRSSAHACSTQGSRQNMGGHRKGKPSATKKIEEKMNHNGDPNIDHDTNGTNTLEDFDNRPLKKAKCSESSVMDDPLPTPTISGSSMISECSESSVPEPENKINGEPLPTAQTTAKFDPLPTPTISGSSMISECSVPESENKINGEPLPTAQTTAKLTDSPVSEFCVTFKMNHNGDPNIDHDTNGTNTLEDFDNRPLKKAKCSESSVMDDPLPTPTISGSSMISECSESSVPEPENKINGEPLPTAQTTAKFDPLPTPTISGSSMISECSVPESENKINGEPLPTAQTTAKLTDSPVSELLNEKTVSTVCEKQQDGPRPIINNVIYDYLPQEYTITLQDESAHYVIQEALEEELLVKIEDVYVKQRYLVCLLDKDKWLDDEVISAYICCMRDQVHVQNDATVYFENPFVTRLLKRDGEVGTHGPTSLTNIVKNYLNHDLIHLPINIKDSHWYLACINVEKSEIQVLDSLCWEHNRDDLANTLKGLQYHLDILKSQENVNNQNWRDLDVTTWPITEKLQKPIQKDSSSCGLFLLKFMEYWTGHTLSHMITQEIITSFRSKLAAILLCWKTNTAPPTATFEEIDESEGHPDDVIMSDSPFDQNQSKVSNSSSSENKYQSLVSVLSNLSLHELVGGLCNYIKSINSAQTLEKIWIKSSDPYPISLTLKNLQEMLNVELPMNRDCFNLVVRKIMFDNIQTEKKRRGLISKHYLDMRFWRITDFARHPEHRKKLHVEQLAFSTRSWPGIKYSISSCRWRNPIAKYVHRILWIAEHLPKAMSKTCPGSTWNENIFLWQQKIIHDISGHRRELSGYLIAFFMSTWEGEKVHSPFLEDGYELRKQTLGQLLTFKENECEDNMPSGVLDFINCIRKTKPI
ncbi:uncharacterized protein LOC124675995 isoform X2 [Lolium rigidum]|uniref:uncharacterized protein LOC124675995 isoform X2 n=1 Tax=Lolium rigidum TaxID=89674 RepID=UPI001F5D778B|nr:uncharacterized protein LOC124675995 isoform X2 [Lolium rigidum]